MARYTANDTVEMNMISAEDKDEVYPLQSSSLMPFEIKKGRDTTISMKHVTPVNDLIHAEISDYMSKQNPSSTNYKKSN